MIPLVLVPSAAPSTTRTTRDRLELLSALIAAPSFDPVLREDVMRFPADHPFYGWGCGVVDCQRPKEPAHDFCAVHDGQWRKVKATTTLADFQRTAEPLIPVEWLTAPPCRICPGIPAQSRRYVLCNLHNIRWQKHRQQRRRMGETVDLEDWIARTEPFPAYGKCEVVACPELSDSPVRLCRRHYTRYKAAGRPGGVSLPANWGRHLLDRSRPVHPSYTDKAAFRRWCQTTSQINRNTGLLSLLGLRPLVKAEIKWALDHHASDTTSGSIWPIPWIQHLANDCRKQDVNSLADVDLARVRGRGLQLVRVMLKDLRVVYFTREDTKEAGFLETDHFGLRFKNRASHFDLTQVRQRWLRDQLWDYIADRFLTDPPRSLSPINVVRRGCVELSSYLEAFTPDGGHDPQVLTAQHAIDFVADQRGRARNSRPALAVHDRDGKPNVATEGTVSSIFDGTRRVLRHVMETGGLEQLGLDRRFVVALPHGSHKGGRRRPFSDNAAEALADEQNLRRLDSLDVDDRGARDIWETLVLTGRRNGEVRDLHLDCLGRYRGLAMLWHDQTKVGNYDEAIRIPDFLYARLETRQQKTVATFVRRHGRLPNPAERSKMALFPRRQSNRSGLTAVGYSWFSDLFRQWIDELEIGHCVPHQARHTLATNLLRNGADLTHIKRYLGQVSQRMAEHYVHLANTDPVIEDALRAVWVSGPGSPTPGELLSAGTPMTPEEATALALDLSHTSTPAEGGFCTFQPVVQGDACPWNVDCHNCDKFVMSGADLVYWRRKREHWRVIAERAPSTAAANYLHQVFEPTARAIDGLEKALAGIGLLEEAANLDLRRPQDYFGRVWNLAFRAQDLANHDQDAIDETAE
jgi:integrase